MNKLQIILSSLGATIVIALFLFGNTVPPKQPVVMAKDMPAKAKPTIHFSDLLAKAKQRLTPEQNIRITSLENSVSRGNVKSQQIDVYKQLARFWKDSARLFEPYAYYYGEAAKLESSEKNLTFAAQQFLDKLLVEENSAMQNWLASNAKVLFEQSLQLNPANDSSKVGLGACYMFGGISDNPMQGILPVREVAQKNPKNIYAQYILGLGGKKSGQYDKAIERFLIVVKEKPDNIEATLHLAECYDLKGDKTNAIKWYMVVKQNITNEDAQKELTKRIDLLKK